MQQENDTSDKEFDIVEKKTFNFHSITSNYCLLLNKKQEPANCNTRLQIRYRGGSGTLMSVNMFRTVCPKMPISVLYK